MAKLVDPSVEAKLNKTSLFKIVIGPLLYATAVVLAFVNTKLAILTYLIIPIIYIIPSAEEKLIFNGKRIKHKD